MLMLQTPIDQHGMAQMPIDGATVYIVACADGSYYTGLTRQDVETCVGEHNNGKFGGFTSTRRPVELVYSAHFERIDEAIATERRIKGWSRAKKEALIHGDFAELSALAARRGRAQEPRALMVRSPAIAGRLEPSGHDASSTQQVPSSFETAPSGPPQDEGTFGARNPVQNRLASKGFLEIGGHRLEYAFCGPQPAHAPTFVLLHEGLGCVGMWGDFPQKLAEASGAGVFVYSREGYGASSPVSLPRPLDYMQRHATNILPGVLDAIGSSKFALIGHSDGASIAAVYAGAFNDERLRAVTLIAPHFFVEDISLKAIAEARRAYETADLRDRLARWHAHVDVAFRGWNDAWLDPGFVAAFDLRPDLARVHVPLQVIQGEDDQYGSLAQVECVINLHGPARDSVVLPRVRHAPHREATDATLAAITRFAMPLLEKDDMQKNA